MKIELLFLGKTKEEYVTRGINDFSNRLSHYVTLEIKYIKIRKQVGKNENAVRAYESSLLNAQIEDGTFRVALDSGGKQVSSEGFSQIITDLEQRSVKNICFVIGGAFGLDDEQRRNADLVLSLSKMTFTHDMVRLLLMEQLYRAYTIKAGEKYHK